MSSNQSLVFYTSHECPFCQRAAIALQELGVVPDETVPIDLSNKPEWYFKVHPEGKVPALKVGEETIVESLIILEYLLEKYGNNTSIQVQDPLARAQSRLFLGLFERVLPHFFKAFSAGVEEYEQFLKGLREINDFLVKQSDGPFLLGEELTYADIAVAPFFARFPLVQEIGFEIPETEEYERVNAYGRALRSRPSVKATTPEWERLQKHVEIFKKRR
ncbi:uncharacterized protein VTP21DRAFT_7953 [Calcarisporiella thermophila]|uniref:uncharacterized protein n=1 Tax=Calcarisporiella thermophila TaxID=911321 RepID=UPI003742DD21